MNKPLKNIYIYIMQYHRLNVEADIIRLLWQGNINTY